MSAEPTDTAGAASRRNAGGLAAAASPLPSPRIAKAPSAFRRCMLSYLASMAVIVAGLYFYTALSPYYIALYRVHWTPSWLAHGTGWTVTFPVALQGFACVYALALLPYYALRPGRFSHAYIMLRHACRRLARLQPPQAAEDGEEDRQAMLCLLLKFIFIPFCIHGLVAYLAYADDQLSQLGRLVAGGTMPDWFSFYNSRLHYLVLNLIFIVDFFPFVVGYLVQSRMLGNEVVSVDASVGGWMACLVCYPPFNAAMAAILPMQVVELAPAYPAFSMTAHLVINGMLLTFFALYAYASVSLGFKCSNLMHRGIVRRGLYRLIRHPAYLFKNLAWWTGAIPLLYVLAQTSPKEFFWTGFCMAGWACIYLLRALAEERHLSRHADYRGYMQQVRFRFIPGLA